MTVREVGVIITFPSSQLANELRSTLLSTLDPRLATDVKFLSTFTTTYPSNLHFYPGPPRYDALISQIRDSRVANADVTGFGKFRPQNQVSIQNECVLQLNQYMHAVFTRVEGCNLHPHNRNCGKGLAYCRSA